MKNRVVTVYPPHWNAEEKRYEWVDSTGTETAGTVEEWAEHATSSAKRQIDTIVDNENRWQKRMSEKSEQSEEGQQE
jgi:hypothetical protein